MSKSAFRLRIFSLYMLIVGVVLIADPNWLLALFGVPERLRTRLEIFSATKSVSFSSHTTSQLAQRQCSDRRVFISQGMKVSAGGAPHD